MKYKAKFYIDYEAEIEVEADNPNEAIRLAKEKYPLANHVPVKHWVGTL